MAQLVIRHLFRDQRGERLIFRRLLGLIVFVTAAVAAAVTGLPPPFATQSEYDPELDSLAQLVNAEWPEVVFSSRLSKAAQSVAEASKDGTVPSTAEVRQALHDAGLPEGNAVTATVATTEDGPTDALDNLANVMVSAGDVTHVGLGRAASSRPPFRWQWAILLIDRRIRLMHEIPAVQQPGAAFPIRFSLPSTWRSPRIIVQYPDDRTRRMTPVRRGETWFTVIPVGSNDGQLVVQILAENEVGPGVVAVMPITIGTARPNHRDDQDNLLESSKPSLTDPSEAAILLWDIVNDERTRHGLHPLQWDETLASIATDHSQDMLGTGFFGHRSPNRGDLRKRLAAASYVATVSRENLAMDQDLESAHQSLMASPGHRSNILAADVTQIGIGIVMDVPDDGPPLWYVTEIFARPQIPPPH